jgi:hypothetical protein
MSYYDRQRDTTELITLLDYVPYKTVGNVPGHIEGRDTKQRTTIFYKRGLHPNSLALSVFMGIQRTNTSI